MPMHTILAVDDSVSMRLMLAHTLRTAGYDVVEACDGLDALDKLANHPISLVLTDQNMPRMDGLALTTALRARQDAGHLPILVLTTESDPTIKAEARAAGATGWLAKPFDPARLLGVIRQVLGA